MNAPVDSASGSPLQGPGRRWRGGGSRSGFSLRLRGRRIPSGSLSLRPREAGGQGEVSPRMCVHPRPAGYPGKGDRALPPILGWPPNTERDLVLADIGDGWVQPV